MCSVCCAILRWICSRQKVRTINNHRRRNNASKRPPGRYDFEGVKDAPGRLLCDRGVF